MSTLAQLEIFFPTQGTLGAIKNNAANVNEILILQDKNIRPIPHFSKIDELKIKVGDLIRTGNQISKILNQNILVKYIRLTKQMFIFD